MVQPVVPLLTLLVRGTAEALHGVQPVAVAPRVACVRVPGALDVGAAFVRGGDPAGAQAALLVELRSRLQGALDRVNAEIEPVVGPHRRANPFH